MWINSLKPSNIQIISIDSQNINAGFGVDSPSFNIMAGNEQFGPSFNKKCLLMVKYVQYETDFILKLTNSTLGNYLQVDVQTTASVYFYFHFLCIADTSTTHVG